MPKTPEIVTFSERELDSTPPPPISDLLEQGRIVLFPSPPIPLPSPENLDFLRNVAPGHLRHKNISYYPEADRLNGMTGPAAIRNRVKRLLEGYHHEVARFFERSLPDLTRHAHAGTSSLRPIEEEGRDLPLRASNERLHVDAGAYGATHGARILRFFTNFHPTKDRVWKVKGTFPDLLREYGRRAGFEPSADSSRFLEERLMDRLFSGLIRTISAVAPMARSLDSSPYDRAMRRFHNYLKESDEFQTTTEGERVVRFPPMSSWMVFTDAIGHACLSGQFALVSTFLLPRDNCRLRHLTPFQVLREFTRGNCGN